MRKIDKLDVIHIKKKADTYIKKNTEIREGQALFCASYDLFPKSTDKLSGTPRDFEINSVEGSTPYSLI